MYQICTSFYLLEYKYYSQPLPQVQSYGAAIGNLIWYLLGFCLAFQEKMMVQENSIELEKTMA